MDWRTLILGGLLGGAVVGGAAWLVQTGGLPAPNPGDGLELPPTMEPTPGTERAERPPLPPLPEVETPTPGAGEGGAEGEQAPRHPDRLPGGGRLEALDDGRPDLVGLNTEAKLGDGTRAFGHVFIQEGVQVNLPAGEVRVSGDWSSAGEHHFPKTTLVFDGGDQILSGTVRAKSIIFRNGVKRLTGGSFGTSSTDMNDLSKPDEAYLVVEKGATLLVRDGAEWKTSNPYGYRIEGTVEVDGGTFRVTFANGVGKKHEDSWRAGSRLVIRRGLFHATGDQAFRGVTIEMHGGKLEVDDDIWHLGVQCTMYGGTIRNTKWGGMCQIQGRFDMYGGTLQANQSGNRGLRVRQGGSLTCTGGTVVIGGQDVGAGGGIYLGESAILPDLQVHKTTRIKQDSPKTSGLAVNGLLTIAKTASFTTTGWSVMANFEPGPDQGTFNR